MCKKIFIKAFWIALPIWLLLISEYLLVDYFSVYIHTAFTSRIFTAIDAPGTFLVIIFWWLLPKYSSIPQIPEFFYLIGSFISYYLLSLLLAALLEKITVYKNRNKTESRSKKI